MPGGKALPRKLLDAMRLEYVSAQPRLTLRQVASKYQVSPSTVMRYSQQDNWPAQRDAYWEQKVAEATELAQHTSQVAAQEAIAERKRVVAGMDWWADMLDGLAQTLAEGFVLSELSEDDRARLLDRVNGLDPDARARVIAQLAAARATIHKAQQLEQGKPTERVDTKNKYIQLSREQAKVLDELLEEIDAEED